MILGSRPEKLLAMAYTKKHLPATICPKRLAFQKLLQNINDRLNSQTRLS